MIVMSSEHLQTSSVLTNTTYARFRERNESLPTQSPTSQTNTCADSRTLVRPSPTRLEAAQKATCKKFFKKVKQNDKHYVENPVIAWMRSGKLTALLL